MQTSDGTPMTRRQYLSLVRDQERLRPASTTTSGPRPALRLVPPAQRRTPRRRALLHGVPLAGLDDR